MVGTWCGRCDLRATILQHISMGVTENRTLEYSVEKGGTAISTILNQSGLDGIVAGWKPLLSNRHMAACIFLQDSQTMRNKENQY